MKSPILSPILYWLLLVFLLSLPISANAAEIKIVALGASQTYGKGASRADTYPAQLESLLKAEGYSVLVANEGVNGDTTEGILSRLDRAVPDGTKIVILQPGTNDKVSTKKRGSLSPEQTLENVEKMLSKLKERHQDDPFGLSRRGRWTHCKKALSYLVWSSQQRCIC